MEQDMTVAEELPGIPPFPRITASVYVLGIWCGSHTLEFGEDGLEFIVKSWFGITARQHIPYSEIFEASFVPATFWRKGCLRIRDRWVQRLILLKPHRDWRFWDSKILFDRRNNEDFCRVYRFLKHHAAVNAKSGEKAPAVQFPEPPFALQEAGSSFLAFGEDALWLSAAVYKGSRIERKILYSEVFDVSFVPGTKAVNGFLCVRQWNERQIPLPKSHRERRIRDSIIFFVQRRHDAFFQAYEFLKQCAAINAETRK